MHALRLSLIEKARDLEPKGLSAGSSGNLSVRVPGGFLITPTGMSYESLQPEDLVEMALDGSVAPGQRRPSSEWHFHRDLYAQREELSAVVHAHPPWSTALACCRREIPAFHYMVAVAGGHNIRCSPYALYGTPELSALALQAMEGRLACLLGNHGLLAAGHSLDHAFTVALQVEELAAQYSRALQIGGLQLLSTEEMDAALKKFANYGRQ